MTQQLCAAGLAVFAVALAVAWIACRAAATGDRHFRRDP